VRGSWVVHFGERIDIGSLATRLTLAFWSKKGDWGLAALELDVEAGQHKLRPDLRGLVGMILGLTWQTLNRGVRCGRYTRNPV
jgi:hypothetical protein